MKLFRTKGGKTQEPQAPAADPETANKTTDSSQEKHEIITIEYGTGYPIDVIYAYIRQDNCQKGYDDAMVNPDISYLEIGKQLINDKLKSLFDQITVKYKDEIRELDTMIRINETMGLTTTALHLQTRKEIYARHLAEIEAMKKGLTAGDEQFQLMIKSYEKGFKTGIAAKSADLLHKLSNYQTPESHVQE